MLFVVSPIFITIAIILKVFTIVIHPNFIYGLLHIHQDAFFDFAFFMLLFSLAFLRIDVIVKNWRMAIFSSGIILFCLYVFLKWRLPDVFYTLDREDSIIEYAQSSFFFAAGIFSFLAFTVVRKLNVKKTLRNVWLALLLLSAIVLMVLAGEEISWGQRIFGISTPEELKAINQQDETTLHNVSFIFKYVYDAYLLMGIYGILSWVVFYIPLRIRGIKISEYLRPVLSRWYLIPYFVVIIGYVVWRYSLTDFHEITAQYFGTNGFLVDNSFDIWEEAAELFPAIAVFLIFLRGYVYLRNYKK